MEWLVHQYIYREGVCMYEHYSDLNYVVHLLVVSHPDDNYFINTSHIFFVKHQLEVYNVNWANLHFGTTKCTQSIMS